ncbi:MAG: GTP-binding protein Era [Saprospiraceae bacterium]|jgi:GTP-binding protein Era
MSKETPHKSGFVNIMGEPNVGKSTLLNALVGEKLSIITNKPQTTRHRIIAIVNEDDYQIVFSDTPGVIYEPGYKMQEAMNSFAYSALTDADILLFMVDVTRPPVVDDKLKARLAKVECPKFLILNKVDLSTQKKLKSLTEWWSDEIEVDQMIAISALEKSGTEELMKVIIDHLPEGPPYYPKDQFSDRSQRFFVSEIIREQILEQYKQEIPYSAEVIVTQFKEGTSAKGPITRISADIIVSRKTQKSIIIGKNGVSIKALSTAARKGIEAFLQDHVYLELYVKVKEKWRDDERSLKSYGYLQ